MTRMDRDPRTGADPSRPPDLPPFELGYPGPLRDALVAATLSGAKTTTSSLLLEYGDPADDPLPLAGQRFLMIDSDLQPVAVVETVEVWQQPMGEIDLQYAIDEGEGYESVAAWREAHERFWREHAPGIPLDDATVVVCERYRVVQVLTPGT